MESLLADHGGPASCLASRARWSETTKMKFFSFALLLSGASSVTAVACSHYVSACFFPAASIFFKGLVLTEGTQSNGVTYKGTCTNQNTCHNQVNWWSVGDCGGGK